MNLNKSQLNKNRKYFFDQYFFENINSEEKAYWLGFVLADGSVRLSKTRGDLRITVASVDRHHLEKFAHVIGYVGEVYEPPNENSCVISLYSRLLSQSLIKLDVIPNKTGYETMPFVEDCFLNHVVRGIFDGDGTIGCYNKSWALAITSGSEELLNKLKIIINNVLATKRGSVDKCSDRNAYRLKFEGNRIAPKVGHFLYKDADIYLDRKYKKYIEMVNL